jgi:hypothetical protein
MIRKNLFCLIIIGVAISVAGCSTLTLEVVAELSQGPENIAVTPDV